MLPCSFVTDALSCALDLELEVGKQIDGAAKWDDLVLGVAVALIQQIHVVAESADVVVELYPRY